MKIIAISGKKGSGKTTLAQYLIEYYENENPNNSPVRMGFADALKTQAVELFGLNPKHVFGSQSDKLSLTDYYRDGKQLTVRECLQQMRDWLHWSRKVVCEQLKIRVEEEKPTHLIIDDLRFPEEVEYLVDWSVRNADQSRLDLRFIRLTANMSAEDQHESETALDPWNFDWALFTKIIHNQGLTPKDTLKQALKCL